MRVALAQLNPTVGALTANAALVADAYSAAVAAGADVVVAPELVLSGYPPEDLLLRDAFIADADAAAAELVAVTGDVALCFGAPRAVRPERRLDSQLRRVANSVVVAQCGEVAGVVDKVLLASHSVFDESRYFVAGVDPAPVEVAVGDGRVSLGVLVCEDLWTAGVADALVAGGAEVLVAVNASPFWDGKAEARQLLAAAAAQRCGVPVVYVNCWGASDGIVFDGSSFVVDAAGDVVASAVSFDADLLVVDVPLDATPAAVPVGVSRPAMAGVAAARFAALWSALKLGVSDYANKNGFDEVLIGLSGGLDSAVTAAVAVDALGPARVRGIAMPGPYSAEISQLDAFDLADRLGIRCDLVPIGAGFDAMVGSLFAGDGPLRTFAGGEAGTVGALSAGVTTENLQARLRGMVLMAVSNATGALVLTTGNKSEISVGYSTLYGDMAGGLGVISDVLKSDVFALARWRNAQGPDAGPIPARTITRPPSAELAPGQQDSDSLPDYDTLDAILELYVCGDRSPCEIVTELTASRSAGVGAGAGGVAVDRAIVDRVVAMVDRNEYKRRQAAPGVKVSAKAFGRDRRLPITNGYRHNPSVVCTPAVSADQAPAVATTAVTTTAVATTAGATTAGATTPGAGVAPAVGVGS